MESSPVKTRTSFIRNKYIEYRRQFLESKNRSKGFSKHLESPKKGPDSKAGDADTASKEPKTPDKGSTGVLDQAKDSNIPTLESLALTSNTTNDLPKLNSDSRLINKLSQYRPQIKAAAARYNLPEALIAGIIWQESRGNSRAVSHCGAMGLMQLMPGTAKQLGVANAFDPGQNIDGGAKYIRQMIDKFGRLDFAVAAYNAGPGNVNKFGGIPPFKETQGYVPKVLSGANEFKVAGGFPETLAPTAVRV